MLRDKLLARLREMGDAPDYQRLAGEVLGIRGASPELARRLVAQALVVEDRREVWRRAGARICASAPASPGVYVLRDPDGRALYVGKAINLRRRLRTHFAERRWRAIKPEMARAADAEWITVGSELEARLDPHDAPSSTVLRARLRALLADDRLFVERLDQRQMRVLHSKFRPTSTRP